MKRRFFLLVLIGTGWGGLVFAEDPLVVVWDKAARVDVGMGYRDNVLRSSISSESCGYVRTAAEASLIRLSSADRMLVLFLLGEDTRYFEGPVHYEQFLSATAQFSTPVGENNEAGGELQYLYQHQIFDASETEANLYRVLVLGHALAGRPYWRQALGEKGYAKLEGTLLRQIYEDELDDYWEEGVRLSLVRVYGHRSEMSLGGRLLRRDYDSRNLYDALGNALPGSELYYIQQEVEGEWKHYFDAGRTWRLSSRLGCMQNEDNGSGYFDYTRILVREQLRWTPGDWDLKLTARSGWYRYTVQRLGGNRRERSYVMLSIRAERHWGEHWLAYAAGEREWNESNDPLDEYRDWYAEGGLGYEF